MSIGALDAVSAYGRSLRIGGGAAPASAPQPAGSSSSASFGDVLKDNITGTAGALRSAEAASAKHVAGQGDLIDVVTAIGAAEVALDTTIAVRDKMVNAYQDIMRMQI